jgi:hypothetical protein
MRRVAGFGSSMGLVVKQRGETLTLDPDGAGITLLAARFYFDSTRAGREGVRQTKDYLRKVGADYGPDVFRRKIVSFVITPGQINYDGGRGFALY